MLAGTPTGTSPERWVMWTCRPPSSTRTWTQPWQGAIVVFGPGNDYSPLGHVAYVESVVNPTSFLVDEANAYGLGIVDQRLISSLTDVEGFIY